MPLRLVNWNVEWATPRSPRSVEIRRRIERHDPEIVCLTEAVIGLSPGDGHTIGSQEDYGYPIREGRRKVLLWSKRPWERVDDVGDRSMPPGRFVAGVTETSIGQLTVIGICIPLVGIAGPGFRRRAEDVGGPSGVSGRLCERAITCTPRPPHHHGGTSTSVSRNEAIRR